jgi:MFS transporter, MHS family, citrate/tricarballylate:H+ symporter
MLLDDAGRGLSPARLRLIHIAAVAAGNGLEFFDFLIYATFAIYIGKAFFPTHDPTVSLLLSLATFGIGFVTRPIGGLVLGRLGDRIGRKPAMLISFSLMGVGALGLAITPTYAEIGVAAPIIVILARLVQGFALGGEVGPSTTFLVEAAPENRRGFFGAMQSASQGVANLAASGVAVLLAFLLSAGALAQWGWRVAFLVGLVIVPFGLMVRRSLPETGSEDVRRAAAVRQPIPWRLVAIGVAVLASGTINTYVGSYMTTYAMDTLHLSAKVAFGVGVVNGVCTVVCVPIGGWLSDRFGRKVVMIPGMMISAAMLLPALTMILSLRSVLVLYAATAAVAIPSSVGGAPIIVSLTESFPASMRCLAVGLIYAVAISIFGGTAQFIVAWLVHATHQPMAPAWYRLVFSLIGIGAMLAIPESSPAKRRVPSLAPALAAP